MADIEEIRSIATQVRHAMDNLIANNEISHNWIPYGRFPKGCCGDISKILIQHFKNLGYGDADYMSGIDYGISSHAWIRLSGICIDITADQFNNQHYSERSFTFGIYQNVIVEYEENYPLSEIFPLDKKPSTRKDFDNSLYKLIRKSLNLE